MSPGSYQAAVLATQGCAAPPRALQGLLRDFLRDLRPVDAGSAQLAVGAFQSYWASLPWPQARPPQHPVCPWRGVHALPCPASAWVGFAGPGCVT